MSGKLYIAAAGAGKTRKIVDESINSNKKVLILTYTIANERQIIDRIKKRKGIIPSNIVVSTWFSFLLKEGIRPYQGYKFKERIQGIIFCNGRSSIYTSKQETRYYQKDNKMYTDKLSECVIELNKISKGKVFARISKIYDVIYIDEVQDMVGYDLEILKELIATKINIIMVGDPRQCTYSTHSEKKNKKYGQGNIEGFLNEKCRDLDIEIDKVSLNITYRNNNEICEFANKLYPDRIEVRAIKKVKNEFEGIKVIKKENINNYLKKSNSVQLRHDKRTEIIEGYLCYNFGESKGLEFKNIVIYPTKSMWDWVIDNSIELEKITRAKFYVAITRASDTVVIVRKDDRKCNLPEILFEKF